MKKIKYLYRQLLDYLIFKSLKNRFRKHLKSYPIMSGRLFDVGSLKIMLNGAAGLMRGIATIFVVNAARHLPGAIFGSILYVQIFGGVLVGYFVFSEIPTLNNYIGNIIIIGAGLYIVFREMQLKKNIVTSTARHPTIPIKK